MTRITFQFNNQCDFLVIITLRTKISIGQVIKVVKFAVGGINIIAAAAAADDDDDDGSGGDGGGAAADDDDDTSH